MLTLPGLRGWCWTTRPACSSSGWRALPSRRGHHCSQVCAWRGRCRRLGGRVRGAGSGCYFVRLLLALAAPSPLLSRGAVLCNLTSGGFVGALTRVAHHKCQVACAVVSRVRNANLAFKWLGYCSTGEHVSVSLIVLECVPPMSTVPPPCALYPSTAHTAYTP